MKPITRLLAVLAAGAGMLAAQPSIDTVVNTASFANPALPNGSLAQGGMFAVIGRNLGPADLELVNAFPLPRELGGTSIRVTVGATTLDCLMIFSLSAQVAAILPSNTPTGNGTLTLSFGGRATAPFSIRVVRSSFGIFSLNQGGSGPGIFTDPGFSINTMVQTARPGSSWFIWGTGLGPVAGNEAAGPLPGDLTGLDVTVLVGGKPAVVRYRGRSGCCAGIDQILIEIPLGVTGCHVPVVVMVGGVPSNYASISITEGSTPCSDTGGWHSADLAAGQQSNGLTAGSIVLSRVNLRQPLGAGAADLQGRIDSASAGFARYDFPQILATQSIAFVTNVGACTVFQFRGSQATLADPVRGHALDAGPLLNINGPRGLRQLVRRAGGGYSETLGGAGPVIPGIPASADYLEPGQYTVSNGAGGAVGPFSVSITIGAPINPTNLMSQNSIPRNRALTLTWTGGEDSREFVQIFGYSVAAGAQAGAAFQCRERPSARTFTIPAEVLAALPASSPQGGLIGLGTVSLPVRITAPGLTVGSLGHSILLATVSNYQ